MSAVSRNPLETMARIGYGARGVVYCLIGGLALLAAFGTGGQTGGSRSALQSVLAQPFGKIWLCLIALGLLGFSAWRIVEAATDADRIGADFKAIAIRAAHVMSGGIYASLAIFALGLALGQGGGGGEDQSAQDWSAWLLAQPFGRWLLGAVGVGIAGTGFGFMGKAGWGDVTAYLAPPTEVMDWAKLLGRLGFAARGVVFALVGGFLILAALHSNSSEVHGLGGALQTLQEQPFGWIILGVTAGGLFAFGLFGFVQARYRHIAPPDLEDAKAAVRQGMGV
jgi:hypothetical protein